MGEKSGSGHYTALQEKAELWVGGWSKSEFAAKCVSKKFPLFNLLIFVKLHSELADPTQL